MRKALVWLVALLALSASYAASAAVRMQFGNYAPLTSSLDGTGVTVRVNGVDLATDLRFGEQTGYLSLGGSGGYSIQVFRSGGSGALVTANANLVDGQSYTGIILGNNQTQPFGLLIAVDTTLTPATGMALVRVIHAAPFSSNRAEMDISVRRADGTVFPGFERISYANISGYVQVPAQTVDLRVTSPDGTRPYVGNARVTLGAGTITTLVVGGDNINQPLSLFSMPASAVAGGIVDQSVLGAWTTNNAPGQGITLFPIPSERRLVGTWYTYAPQGGAVQWYTMDSCGTPIGQTGCAVPNAFDNRRAIMTVYAFSGGQFLGAAPVASRVAGTLTIEFQSCTRATATYNVDGRAGQFAMTNLLPQPGCTITP